MTKTTKLYADGIFVSKDENLIEDLKMVMEAKNYIPEEQHDVLYKQFCNKIRKSLDIENVIGVVLSDDETEVYVPYFAINATGDNHYKLGYNFEEENFYMELEQHPSLEVIDLAIQECTSNFVSAFDFEETKIHFATLCSLYDLRRAVEPYIKLQEEVEAFAKMMMGAVPTGVGIVVRP
ncbi:hypothetical protein [Bacillus paranthracis]|uniref:hypothetical protein n=1 Tax=Bacillus paranthracis TaxID=2026186 RepID=UPI002D78E837|nr:hypothetical protein [Bacillus paranthracis]